MKFWPLVFLLPLTACAGRAPAPAPISESQCLGLADSLKTIRVGDPLPRVKEILGTPGLSYRTTTTFGGKYDVLELYTGDSPCTRYMLDSPHKLVLLFDTQGRYIGHGQKRFLPLRGATSNRLSHGGW